MLALTEWSQAGAVTIQAKVIALEGTELIGWYIITLVGSLSGGSSQTGDLLRV